MGAEANGEGTQTVEATAGSEAAEPRLFEPAATDTATATGATGLPNAGTATDEGATLKRWREIAGLTEDDGR